MLLASLTLGILLTTPAPAGTRVDVRSRDQPSPATAVVVARNEPAVGATGGQAYFPVPAELIEADGEEECLAIMQASTSTAGPEPTTSAIVDRDDPPSATAGRRWLRLRC